MDARAVDRELRALLWPRLREEGFSGRKGRAAWRYWDGGVEVVEVQSVGAAWAAVGCTSFSFSAYLGSWPEYLADILTAPSGKDGRPRPHYWHCPLVRTLNKTIAQPWFKAFGREPERPLTAAMAKHREGLRGILRKDVHDRPDVWYALEDGSNLEVVVSDLVQVLLAALPDLISVRDPCVTATRLERGDFVVPESPRGHELIRAANSACLGRT